MLNTHVFDRKLNIFDFYLTNCVSPMGVFIDFDVSYYVKVTALSNGAIGFSNGLHLRRPELILYGNGVFDFQ